VSLTALALALALTAPPTYVAERVVTVGEVARRVSVFRDGTAVVAVREGLGEPTVIRQRLAPIELQVVIQVVNECYDELQRLRPPEFAPGGSWTELRLAPPGRDALIVRLPAAGTPHAVVVRIAQALDGVENRLISFPGDREDLSQWLPAVGERARLTDGRVVDIGSVTNSSVGLLIGVRVVGSPVGQVFTLEELRRVAVSRVKR
jgi:hypothetical protein